MKIGVNFAQENVSSNVDNYIQLWALFFIIFQLPLILIAIWLVNKKITEVNNILIEDSRKVYNIIKFSTKCC